MHSKFLIVPAACLFVALAAYAAPESGETSLLEAVFEGNEPKVRALLEAGANPNAKDDDGWTPLHYTAGLGQPSIAELLLQAGADPNAKDNFGATPLHKNLVGATPLHYAASGAVLSISHC